MAGRGKKKNSYISNSNIEWYAGIYTRRSFDDNEDFESNTITNQKELITNFLSEIPNMNIVDFYIDDGFTGTNFNRPDFKRLMDDIKYKKINCIVVKDLSRLGRNYIEVGKYIEEVFPLMELRIISINDNVDSYLNPKSISDLIIPIKNLINETYSRDISQKVSSAYKTMAKAGKFVGGTSPYGYTFDPNDKHHLIINENEAKIVRKIYNMALNGDGRIKISKYLNEKGILCRKELQRREKHNLSLNPNLEESRCYWSTTTIGRILTSEVYIGNLEQLKTTNKSYKDKSIIYKEEDEWIRVKNTHDAIISKEIFKKVQTIKNINLRPHKKGNNFSIYNGILKCSSCGRAMIKQEDNRGKRNLSNYFCATYLRVNKKCTPHKIKSSDLDKIVLESIQLHIKLVVELERSLKKMFWKNNKDSIESEYQNNIKLAEIKINRLKEQKKEYYESWKFGKIEKNDFIKRADEIEKEISLINEKKAIDTSTYRENIKRARKNDYWIDHYKRNRKIKHVSKDVLKELIEVIYVNKDGSIEIKFKYNDEYLELLNYLKTEGEKEKCLNGELEYI